MITKFFIIRPLLVKLDPDVLHGLLLKSTHICDLTVLHGPQIE